MATVIPQRDLRNHNARIIERVSSGEEFVVTRDGVPVADLRPHEASETPPRVRATTELGDFLATPTLDAQAWMADIRAVDDVMTDDPFDGPAAP